MPKVFEAPNGKKYTLNPDNQHVKHVIDALRQNDGYCPCRVEKSDDTKCPCVPYKQGLGCICALYVEADDE